MAIARDASSYGHTNSASSLTISHTCTGSNLILITMNLSVLPRTISTITYNGTNYTSAVKKSSSNISTDGQIVRGGYLRAPSTGTNNIVVTPDASTYIYVGSESITGASDFDSSGENGTLLGTLTVTWTVIAANSWAYYGVRNVATGNSSASTGSTSVTNDAGVLQTYDSNGGLSAGSQSMSVTGTAGGMEGVVLAFSPVAAAATANPAFLLNFV